MRAADSSPHSIPYRRPFRVSWPSPWTLVVLFLAALLASPVAAVLGIALQPSGDLWSHLADTVFLRYLTATLGLGAGVGLANSKSKTGD